MLSSASKHSLIILGFLANADSHDYYPVAEIAERTGTPAPYLSKLVMELVRAGILESKRGVRGGIRLNRDACSVSLYEVCQVVKDPVVKKECVLREQACTPSNPCEYHAGCAEIDAIRGHLLRFLKDSKIGGLKATNC